MRYIPIGTIAKPHGVKGAVHVKTDSDFKASRYKKGNVLFIKTKEDYMPVTVLGCFEKKGFDVLTFEDFSTKEMAEKYMHATLYVRDDDRETLEDDEFYYTDLIGLDVLVNDEIIGQIEAVKSFPQGDMLVIKRKEKKPVLVPFQKRFVTEVTEKHVQIVDMEGLL